MPAREPVKTGAYFAGGHIKPIRHKRHPLSGLVLHLHEWSGDGDQPPPRPLSALQRRIAQAPVAATLLNPLQIAERAVILVLVVGIDAGFQARLAGRLA